MQHLPKRRLLRALVLIGLASASSACEEPMFDDWGGPSGYAAIEGVVTLADGSAVPVDTEVSLTLCGFPIGGLAGKTRTGPGGSYSIRGELNPPDMPEAQDTLTVSCELIAGRFIARSGPIDVLFYRPPTEPTPIEVNFSGS